MMVAINVVDDLDNCLLVKEYRGMSPLHSLMYK